ncbi:MAG: 3-methyl-2-oxobutanoate hydroxymethyltransferase [Phycisphaeraceae bacterium]
MDLTNTTEQDAPAEHAAASTPDRRVTLRDWRQWAEAGKPFAMLTCYDATTAKWLWRGGVTSFLVGDTAAQLILGHDSTLPAKMPFMLEITAAVRRGAPHALIMADMPFGSYQADEAEAVRNAIAFMQDAGADCVKLEVDGSHATLVEKLAQSGVPVVAHLGSRPQQVRVDGGYQAAGRTEREADVLVDTAQLMIAMGAHVLLIEAVPDEVSQRIVDKARHPRTGARIPVIGCGAGPACDGHVVVMHDLMGLSDWQPPFARPIANFGPAVQEAASRWSEQVASGKYLADGGVYQMKD